MSNNGFSSTAAANETHEFKAPTGVLLVGSVPLSSTEEVFSKATKVLPGRLHSIPDGETGHRHYFVRWQAIRLKTTNPELAVSEEGPVLSEDQLRDTIAQFDAQGGYPTHYDTYALESYETFVKLKKSGIVPASTKFQVSIPTPINLLMTVRSEYRSALESVFQKAVLSDLRAIMSAIPAQDLVIQWDCASEFAILEAPNSTHRFAAGFTPDEGETHLRALARRLASLVDAIDPRVEVGLHCCYGDFEHKHFIEPKDLAKVVEFVNAIREVAKRDLVYVHMPVPIERTDEAYFEPVTKLKTAPLSRQGQDVKIFLGLVHHDDLAGTRRRIETARKVLPGLDFGVATECGMGRTPLDQIEGILEILAEVSNPY